MGKTQAKQNKTAKKAATKNNFINNKKKTIAKAKTRNWANYILFRVMIVGVIVILLSVYFNTGSGKDNGNEQSSVQEIPQNQETAENNAVAEGISANDTDYGHDESGISEEEDEENPDLWQPDTFVMYKKEIQIKSINTSIKSDWYCTITTTDGETFAVYQPYLIDFLTTNSGYMAKGTHQLSPSAMSSWVYDVKNAGFEEKSYYVRIQNYPEINEENPYPNGTNEIPRDMDYIIELIKIKNLETGAVTYYSKYP